MIDRRSALKALLGGSASAALIASQRNAFAQEVQFGPASLTTAGRANIQQVGRVDREHTLHAFAFTTVALHFLPALAVILIPFTALVSVSRVVLGLHYPSDVAAGAVIGILLAHLVLSASTLV